LLRNGDVAVAPTAPTPGLAQLPDLAESFASTGLHVEVETIGTPRPLDPGVDLTAFRIVQEALTNVKKHAVTEKARVRVAYTDDEIAVTVVDEADRQHPKTAGSSANSGFGLIGMRERANSVGGRLRAGRRPEGGFQVAADLPLRVRNPEPGTDADPAAGGRHFKGTGTEETA